MISNHRIHKARVEAMKGIGFVNDNESPKKIAQKQFLTAQKMQEYEMLEEMCTHYIVINKLKRDWKMFMVVMKRKQQQM